MTVAFFGHSDATSEILPRLTALAEDLILNHGATTLYVGNHGNFDVMTAALFRTLRERYPHLRCYVVRAYLPSEGEQASSDETLYPEGLETVPQRFAISHRNRWMVEHSDEVVCYVTHPWGGAHTAMEYARRKKKTIYML